ncbi:hypothetical protein F0562_015803 [Nyssa sinensis]|uniref:Uncharacterized protein n=1 Tax=Nyssa sinensis TaxID=561372 RepID=A0A5J4ZKG8_9ASTE|nr:hypothetical protein F0562_015803 [Nyssa sinensis]
MKEVSYPKQQRDCSLFTCFLHQGSILKVCNYERKEYYFNAQAHFSELCSPGKRLWELCCSKEYVQGKSLMSYFSYINISRFILNTAGTIQIVSLLVRSLG